MAFPKSDILYLGAIPREQEWLKRRALTGASLDVDPAPSIEHEGKAMANANSLSSEWLASIIPEYSHTAQPLGLTM